jgi:hypothetical protein
MQHCWGPDVPAVRMRTYKQAMPKVLLSSSIQGYLAATGYHTPTDAGGCCLLQHGWIHGQTSRHQC